MFRNRLWEVFWFWNSWTASLQNILKSHSGILSLEKHFWPPLERALWKHVFENVYRNGNLLVAQTKSNLISHVLCWFADISISSSRDVVHNKLNIGQYLIQNSCFTIKFWSNIICFIWSMELLLQCIDKIKVS